MDEHAGPRHSHNVGADDTGGSPGTAVPYLRDMIDQLRDRASKIASFAAEFNSIASAIDARSKKLLSAEEKINEERKELARRMEELDRKSKDVEQLEETIESEKAAVESKLTDLGGREERFERLANYIQVRVIRVREVEEEVEEKRRQVEAKEKEMKECFNSFRLREKGFEDQLAEFKNKQAEFQVRLTELSIKDREIENKEKGLAELESNLRSRERGFEQRVNEINKKERDVDGREKHSKEVGDRVEQSSTELQLREKGFHDRFLEFMTKQVKFKDKERVTEEKERCVEQRLKDVILREEGFQKKGEDLELMKKAIEEKDRKSKELQLQVRQCSDDLKAKEKRFHIQLAEFKGEEAQFRTRLSELRAREKDLAGKDEEFQRRYDDLKSRDKCLELRLEDFKVNEAKLQDEMRVKEREIQKKEKKHLELELKFEQLSRDLRVKEKDMAGTEEEFHRCYDDLKSRYTSLEHRLEDFRVKEGKLQDEMRVKEREIEKKEKKHKEIEVKCEQLSRDLRAKERETKTREKQFILLEHEVEDCKKRLAQFQVYDSRYRSVKLRENKLKDGFKMLDRRIKDFELKEMQLEAWHKEVDSKAKRLSNQMKEQELKDKKQVERMRGESALKGKKLVVKIEPTDTSVSHNSLDHSSDADIRFCVTMNGADLQIFLNERSDHLDFMIDEIETALKLSSNPAKLVLDAMQGFYTPHLKKGDVEFEEAVIRKSCIMLLELLTRLSPEIKPNIRKEAMKLTADWMTRMRSDAQHSMEVLAVMQLSAAYGLGSAFEDDDLVSHLGVIAHYDQAPKLLQDLGLADKVSSVIQKLLEKKLQVEAARFISAFGLHAEFPSVTLPKDNEESSFAPLFGNKSVAASTTPVLLPSSETGTKRPRPDSAPVNLPAQQLKRLKLPAQQPDRSSLTGQPPETSLRAHQPNSHEPAHVTYVEVTAHHRLNLTNSLSQQPEGIKSPAQQPEGFGSHAQQPEGLKSHAQQPEWLKSPAQQPEWLKSPAQQPERLKSPAQQPERLKSPAQQPEVLLPSDQGCCNPSPMNAVHSGARNRLASSPSKSTSQLSKSANTMVPLPPKSSFVPKCLENGGVRLRALCRKIESNKLFCPEITDALGLASDPAEFVLGVVKNPSTLNLSRGTEAVSLSNPQHGSLLLLNCMWRKSPHLKPDVKKEALSFAKDWNSKLVNQRGVKDNLEVVCFLLFLAAYKLVSYLDQDEFFGVFDKGYWREYAIKLFGFLGFKDFIPKFLEYLMRTNQHLEALQCINVSNMLDNSPSARALLSDYLLKCSKKFHSTGSNFFQRINQELRVWKAVAQCIEDQDVVKQFQARILALHEQKQKHQQQHNADAASLSASVAAIAATTYTPAETSIPQPQDESRQNFPIEPKRTRWSNANIQPPRNPLQGSAGPSAIHYPNPAYGYPGYPHPVIPSFQSRSYDYPGLGRSVPY